MEPCDQSWKKSTLDDSETPSEAPPNEPLLKSMKPQPTFGDDPVDLRGNAQLRILLCYFAFFLFCVPIWWHLTGIERHSLPDEINEPDVMLPNSEFVIPFRIHWRGTGGVSCSEVETRLRATSSKISPSLIFTARKGTAYSINDTTTYGFPLRPEITCLPKPAAETADAIAEVPATGVWDVYIVSNFPGRLASAQALPSTELISDKEGRLYIKAATDLKALDVLDAFYHYFATKLPKVAPSLRFAKRYEIVSSLLIQNPFDFGHEATFTWPAAEVQALFLRPFLDATLGTEILDFPKIGDRMLSPYFCSSQIQYYAQPGPGFLADNRKLHLFRNADWNLASLAQNASTLHLILYLASDSSMAEGPSLTVSGEIWKQIQAVDIIVPRWGSIAIRPSANATFFKDHEKLASLWISHLRELLGITPLDESRQKYAKAAVYDKAAQAESERGKKRFVFTQGRHGLSVHELQLYRIQRTLENYVHSMATLTALARLADDQTRLPIVAELVVLVREALESLEIARRFSVDAWVAARRARTAAEEAFFHPEMVGMLYFPDEHKYAIYLPFFMPVILGVLRAAKNEFARRRAIQKLKIN